jgi:hypothetical protein
MGASGGKGGRQRWKISAITSRSHAELHRRFKAKSYGLIRVGPYPAVPTFLDEWDRAMEQG